MNQKVICFFLTILSFCLTITLFAERYTISGTITNQSTGQPVPDANIRILDSDLGTVSRDGGFFSLENIEEGNYQVEVSVIGYKKNIQKIFLSDKTTLNFKLTPRAIEYDPVIVTATLSDHSQSNVTTSSEVLTKRRMQELNGNTAGEMIESVGSVYIKSADGLAGVSSPSIRGSKPEQVVLMIDGIRLNSAQGTPVSLNTIPLAAIERIEVVKGGHSAILGADAVGGAINLISTSAINPKRLNSGASTTIGSYGTQIHTIHGARSIGAMNLFVSYSRTQSDGDFKFKSPVTGKTEKRINNDVELSGLFVKGSYQINSKHAISAIYHHHDSENGVAGSVNANPWTGLLQTSPLARMNDNRHVLKIESRNQVTHKLYVKSQIGFHAFNREYNNPDAWPSKFKHENEALSANIHASYSQNENLKVTGGVNYQKDDLKTTSYDKVNTRNMKSVFGQLEFKHTLGLTQWVWIPAIRYDDYSDVRSNISPKIGVMATSGNLTLKGNAGQSYRVPTFDDLYWPDESYGEGWGGAGGNPDLKPETGTSFDFGFSYNILKSGMIQVQMDYFNSNIDDLIEWAQGNDLWWRPSNVGKAKITGFETGVKFRASSEKIYANVFYTKMKATDETEGSLNKGNRLVYRPDDKWDLIVGTKIGPIHANVNYRIVSKSYINADNSSSLAGYRLVNANIGTSFNVMQLKLKLRLQALNLTDELVFLNDGYPLPGREFRFTVGFKY